MSNHDQSTALLARLGEQAEALRSSDGWLYWLEAASKFHNYSLNNQLLILSQRPDATRVAGYRAWQSMNRQVRKGERSLKIFAPSIRKTEDPATGEKRSAVVGFRLVSVFDLSQTDGDPLPEPEMPAVASRPEGLFEHLTEVAASNGWTVDTVDTSTNGARGWWTPDTGTISIASAFDPASRTRTMLHELGHAFDHVLDGGNEHATRAERELIAESVAFLVGTDLGVDLNEASTFYVTSWGADTDTLLGIAERVLKISEALRTSITTTQIEVAA